MAADTSICAKREKIMVWEYRQASAYVIFLNKCQIRGWVVGWDARDAPSPLSPNYFILMLFSAKILPNRLAHPTVGLAHPGNPGSAAVYRRKLFSARNFSSKIDMDLALSAGGAFRRHIGGAVAHDAAPSGRVLLRLCPWREHRRGDVLPGDPGWAHRCGATSRGLLSVWGHGVRWPSGWNITGDIRGTICIHR